MVSWGHDLRHRRFRQRPQPDRSNHGQGWALRLKENQFFFEQVASFARKLDAIQEGPCTLLDNTMLLYCSSMLTGNHEAGRLPVVMLGGAGGRFQGGRVLNYEGKSERQMHRLYLSTMDKMNVRLPKFGDATRALEEM